MNKSDSKNRDCGFTLVEVLVAMFIFSIISVGSVSALSAAMNGKTQIDERLDFIGDIGSARALMTADFDAAILRPARDSFGTAEPYAMQGGVDNLISFTRYGRSNPGGLERRGDLQRVSYHFENGNLIRRVLAHENPAQNTAVQDRVLLSAIADIDIVFFKAGQNFSLPVIQVPINAKTPPSGLKLSIIFDDGRALAQAFEFDL